MMPNLCITCEKTDDKLKLHMRDTGFSTGALFRSTRGPRAAAVAGAFGLVCAGLLIGARETIDTGL